MLGCPVVNAKCCGCRLNCSAMFSGSLLMDFGSGRMNVIRVVVIGSGWLFVSASESMMNPQSADVSVGSCCCCCCVGMLVSASGAVIAC